GISALGLADQHVLGTTATGGDVRGMGHAPRDSPAAAFVDLARSPGGRRCVPAIEPAAHPYRNLARARAVLDGAFHPEPGMGVRRHPPGAGGKPPRADPAGRPGNEPAAAGAGPDLAVRRAPGLVAALAVLRFL